MNKYIYSAAAFLSLSCIALTSCQNEMEQIGAPAGKEVLLRVTANRGDAETRTTLTPDGGDLVCNWSEGDQLMVVENSKGTKLGVITITDGVGTPNGTFEGKVNLEGQEALSLVYLGKAGDAESYQDNYIEINLSAQDGSLSSLPKMDVLTAEARVDDQNFLPANNTIETSITMTRQLAFGHFTLDFGGDVTLEEGDVINIAGEGLRSEGTVRFKNGGFIPSVTNYSGSTTITVTKAEGGNDFYVTMLPCGNVTPTFTVVKGGETYTATLGQHNWISGEYVRAYADGNDSGVSVTMEKVAKIDHSVNPLAKWAEGDLVRSGSGKTVRGTISNNPLASGSYYQFGRNYGYNSASDVTQLCTQMNLTSGTYTYRGLKYTATPENGLYSATGKKLYVNQNDQTVREMSDYPAMFFMNAGDYLSPEYTENWEQRAISCGYTYKTPCPDTWTIPTKADFEQILPEINNEVGSTSWTTLTQVKLIGENEIPCAFRWSKEGSALKIESLVLASKDMTPNWNDDNVEVRYFSLSGCLTPVIQSGLLEHTDIFGNVTTTFQYVADVRNFGLYDNNAVFSHQSGRIKYYYISLFQTVNYMNETGFYWTSDADQQVFTLNTNSSISSYPNVGYYFTKANVTIAARIRCIKK